MKSEIACSVLLFAAALGLYSFTAAPDIPLVDSGELGLAAATGSVAHPPGFPLYLLAGKCFCSLPFPGTPIRKLNWMSAFFMALSVPLLFFASCRASRLLEQGFGKCPEGTGAPGRFDSGAIGAGLLAALVWCTARNPWSWSSVAEVYALNTALGAACWACLFHWARNSARHPAGKARHTWLIAALATASLGLANHHATAVLLFPPLVLLVLTTNPRALRNRAVIAWGLACVGVSLSLYLYLFLLSRSPNGLNWGRIRGGETFRRHVLGTQYHRDLAEALSASPGVALQFLRELIENVGILPSLVALLGGAILWARALGHLRKRGDSSLPKKEKKSTEPSGEFLKRLLAVTGPPLLLILLNVVLAVAPIVGAEDRSSYDLPGHAAWVLLFAVGLRGLLWFRPVLARPPVLGLLGLALVVPNLVRNFSTCNLRHEKVARTFVVETLGALEPGSVVFTTEWNLYAPYLYMRHVEGYRPDVFVVDVLLMRRFWYADYLERTMPDSLSISRDAFTRFRDQVYRFDLGKAYRDKEIAEAYTELMKRWASSGMKRGGAYLDAGCLQSSQEMPWIRTGKAVPWGMLVRLFPPGVEAHPMPVPPACKSNLATLRRRAKPLLEGRASYGTLPVRYWKVYQAYRNAIEAGLLHALLSEGPLRMSTLAASYREWFEDTDKILKSVLQKQASSGIPLRTE